MSLALVACGAGAESVAAPSSLPLVESPTTTAEAASPETSLVEAAEQTDPAPAEFSADMFESMLATEGGRALLVSSMAAETSMTPQAAACLLDVIPPELLVEAAGSFLGGSVDAGLFPEDRMDEVLPLLESCDIPLESLLP